MNLRRSLLFIALGFFACCALLIAAGFAALHSPWLLTRLGGALGYNLSARTVSFSPSLSGSISDLSLKSREPGGPSLIAANVTARNSLGGLLQGEVDTLVLQSPKFTFRVGGGEKGGKSGLSFLLKIPKIRLLEVRDAGALVTFAGEPRQIRLTHLNLTVKNFSAGTGGSVAFRAHAAFTSGPGGALAASGTVKGDFRLTGVYPKPYGKGTLELALDSGAFRSGRRTISLSGLAVAADLVYERRTETFAVTSLRAQGGSFGAVKGSAEAVLRGERPWSAALSVEAIDFAQVFAALKPLLPEEYRAWTMQGKGGIETRMQGTYAGSRLSLQGDVAFSFRRGGFSSPDGSKAAQGVTGKMVLKLQYGEPEKKLKVDFRSEESGGEVLWGDYYADFAGEKAALAANGEASLNGDPRFDLSGSLDLFQTGAYSFQAGGTKGDWSLRLQASKVSHERIVDRLLKDYLEEISPALDSLSVTGTSSLQAVIRRRGSATEVSGTYRMDDTTLKVPKMELAVARVGADLPFDLEYPPSARTASLPAATGFIRFQMIRRKRLTIDRLDIPVLIAGNTLEVPGEVRVPFFGGAIRLYGIRVDNLPFPTSYRFGVKIDGVDLGRMTRRLTGTEFPGTINADLGLMTYRHGRLESEGKAQIEVFGGRIEVSNLFAENIASPAMRFGGDVTFRNINLEDVTRKIPVGKMTGIVQGSLRSFVMEYGQPASFTLEVESVDRSGVSKRISMDAIQSISILGTGAGGALNRGLLSFFKEFPYRRIGFRCVLHNDEFSVRGTIHAGGKEYLVRRGFFGGVDVVNQNPHNVISFKDMQERIERIYRQAETESGTSGSAAVP